MTPEDIEKQQIKKIHVLVNALGIDRILYKDMLWDMFKRYSSKELNFGQRSSLIAKLEGQFTANKATPKQRGLINYLAPKYTSDINAFAAKIARRDNAQVDNLSKQEAIRVIDALKRLEKRALKTA